MEERRTGSVLAVDLGFVRLLSNEYRTRVTTVTTATPIHTSVGTEATAAIIIRSTASSPEPKDRWATVFLPSVFSAGYALAYMAAR